MSVEHLQKGLDRCPSEITTHYLFGECRAARASLMVEIKEKQVVNAIVFRFENRQSENIANILCLGGEGQVDWQQAILEVKEVCKPFATKIRAEGRLGWKKKIPEATIVSAIYEWSI